MRRSAASWRRDRRTRRARPQRSHGVLGNFAVVLAVPRRRGGPATPPRPRLGRWDRRRPALTWAIVEAAFFDLDKTVIAKSSVLAFGRPFYREGLLSRAAIVKSAYAQVVFMLVGADEGKMEKLRVAMLELIRGWNRRHVAEIVRETLEE